jgi:DNA-binding NtrC family response regulator
VSCNLLLVEDHLPSRRNLALALQLADHTVFEAETGEDALNLVSSVAFGVVVSDYRLPGMTNGLDVLRRQKEKDSKTRLVLITAFGSQEVQSEAAALGAFYVEKPFSLADMLSIISG